MSRLFMCAIVALAALAASVNAASDSNVKVEVYYESM